MTCRDQTYAFTNFTYVSNGQSVLKIIKGLKACFLYVKQEGNSTCTVKSLCKTATGFDTLRRLRSARNKGHLIFVVQEKLKVIAHQPVDWPPAQPVPNGPNITKQNTFSE
jgi:hypothetical protein